MRSRASELKRSIAITGDFRRRAHYAQWIKGCFIFSLVSALNTLNTCAPDDHAFTDAAHPEHVSAGWQAQFTKMIRPKHEQDALVHLRRRLDRWISPVLQGHRVDRFVRHMRNLATLVAPRVLAAILRTALNGWTTARRFQGVSLCVLGCGGPDSIEHYSCCSSYHCLSSKFLGLARPTAEHLVGDFVGLVSASTSWANRTLETFEVVALRAIAIYALHRVHGSIRHGAARSDASELFRGFLRRATVNHAKSSSPLCRVFKRPREDH